MMKSQMRQAMLQQLDQITEEQYTTRSAKIVKRLFRLPVIEEAQVIAITISRYPEVDTYALIEQLWNMGKTVVVPKCLSKTKEMDFRKITSFTQLEIAYAELLEPIIHETTSFERSEIDLVIVPGVIFDVRGYRIGFGGGYYDRYLANCSIPTIALAFSEQVVVQVPTNQYDISVDYIVTDFNIVEVVK